VSPQRRRWLKQLGRTAWACALPACGLPARAAEDTPAVRRGRVLQFPRDHGAHPPARTEWWYATGWAGTPEQPTHGFQVTFFRSSTGLAQRNESRFAARHLLFAHAAVTALNSAQARPQHLHDQRIARWSGDPTAQPDFARTAGGGVQINRWSFVDAGAHWQAQIPAADFELQLQLKRMQPLLLQGEAGFSRKGPDAGQASHYYSEPQLAVSGSIRLKNDAANAGVVSAGSAWLDHEWSDEYLHPQAVGWDWIGINLFDGSALTAFALRRADGSALWAGGSLRRAGQASRSFSADEVHFVPGRIWTSPASGARYPVQWQLEVPGGPYTVRALMDAQELDSSRSTGTVYWEGLSEVLNAQGQRVGLGYLEMTGYAGRLRM
jgi:predicted secreted hydrolase